MQWSRENGLTGPFPLEPTPDWAWLEGLWFGCGSYTVRDRKARNKERKVVFRVEYPVKDELVRIGQRIGCVPLVSSYICRENKIYPRVRVMFPAPVYYLLRRWGLPAHVKSGEHTFRSLNGRQRTAREVHLHVPKLARLFPREFVEGYLNSSRFQAWHKANRQPWGSYWHDRGAHLTFVGRTEKQVTEFMGFVQSVLAKADVRTSPYRLVKQGKNVNYKLQIHGNDDRILRTFRILRANASNLISEDR